MLGRVGEVEADAVVGRRVLGLDPAAVGPPDRLARLGVERPGQQVATLHGVLHVGRSPAAERTDALEGLFPLPIRNPGRVAVAHVVEVRVAVAQLEVAHAEAPAFGVPVLVRVGRVGARRVRVGAEDVATPLVVADLVHERLDADLGLPEVLRTDGHASARLTHGVAWDAVGDAERAPATVADALAAVVEQAVVVDVGVGVLGRPKLGHAVEQLEEAVTAEVEVIDEHVVVVLDLDLLDAVLLEHVVDVIGHVLLGDVELGLTTPEVVLDRHLHQAHGLVAALDADEVLLGHRRGRLGNLGQALVVAAGYLVQLDVELGVRPHVLSEHADDDVRLERRRGAVARDLSALDVLGGRAVVEVQGHAGFDFPLHPRALVDVDVDPEGGVSVLGDLGVAHRAVGPRPVDRDGDRDARVGFDPRNRDATRGHVLFLDRGVARLVGARRCAVGGIGVAGGIGLGVGRRTVRGARRLGAPSTRIHRGAVVAVASGSQEHGREENQSGSRHCGSLTKLAANVTFLRVKCLTNEPNGRRRVFETSTSRGGRGVTHSASAGSNLNG